MQDILHTTIIAIPTIFAAFMLFDLIANLKLLWKSCEPSTSLSIPASTPLLEEAPAKETEESEAMPDPWELDTSEEELSVTPRLAIALDNLLLLPPAKETLAPTKAKNSKKPAAPSSTPATAKRRGRPRKAA